jgi:hypothetical protein
MLSLCYHCVIFFILREFLLFDWEIVFTFAHINKFYKNYSYGNTNKKHTRLGMRDST